MKTGDTFNTKAAMALLLLGDSGTGKSSLAIQFPSPWFCLCDKNIKHAAQWASEKGHQWFWDDPDLSATGVSLPWESRWDRANELLRLAGADPNVKVIVDDGLTQLSGYLMAKVIHLGSKAEGELMVGGEKVMSRSMWQPFAMAIKKRIITARSYGKPYIMIAHLQVDENELSKLKEQKVNLQGALKNELAGWFTDVLQCVAEPSSDPRYKDRDGIRRYVRTAPTHRIQLKNSFRLKPEVDFDDFIKLVVEQYQKDAATVTTQPATTEASVK